MPDTIIKKMIIHQKDSSGNDIIMRPQTEVSQIIDFNDGVNGLLYDTYATKTEMANINKNTSRSVEFIAGTQTAATPSFTGITEDSSLYDGKCINYYLPYAGTSAGDTLNLTLADGTTTGAKQIYLIGTTKLTTHFVAGQIFMMTYSATKDAWYCGNYDSNSNTYDRILHNSSVKAASAITKSFLIVGDSAGYKNITANATFDITYPILFASAAFAANATVKTTYDIYPDVNLATIKSGWTGTQYAVVFLVGTLSGKTFTIDSTIFTTTVPSTADGKVYIPLGVMSTTTTVYFSPINELFEYKNGSFKLYDPTVITTGTTNGTISVNGTEVAVAGLNTGAYEVAYTHPTTAGNKHIPSGGSSGQILRYSSSGTAVWGNETTYDTMTASEATTGTSTDGKLISPKVLADYVSANAGGTGTYYGTCATAAATAAKVVTCADFTSLTTGASISVKFTYTNTAASPTMNVNSTGAKAIYYHNANVGANKILANTVYNFVYDGSNWQLIDTAYPLYYGTCSTAAGTVAKVVSCAGFALVTGIEITVKFTVTNTASSPTLNVNSTGAKAIYYKGAAITAGYLAANKIYKFVYDGSYWQLVGDVDSNTTYTAMTQAVATAGTSTTANTISAKVLNDTIDAKINEIEIADYKDY